MLCWGLVVVVGCELVVLLFVDCIRLGLLVLYLL